MTLLMIYHRYEEEKFLKFFVDRQCTLFLDFVSNVMISLDLLVNSTASSLLMSVSAIGSEMQHRCVHLLSHSLSCVLSMGFGKKFRSLGTWGLQYLAKMKRTPALIVSKIGATLSGGCTNECMLQAMKQQVHEIKRCLTYGSAVPEILKQKNQEVLLKLGSARFFTDNISNDYSGTNKGRQHLNKIHHSDVYTSVSWLIFTRDGKANIFLDEAYSPMNWKPLASTDPNIYKLSYKPEFQEAVDAAIDYILLKYYKHLVAIGRNRDAACDESNRPPASGRPKNGGFAKLEEDTMETVSAVGLELMKPCSDCDRLVSLQSGISICGKMYRLESGMYCICVVVWRCTLSDCYILINCLIDLL